jgi:4-hydroxy-tetrahydrodipicolinate reductase
MGLGFMGQSIARATLQKPELRIAAAIDPAHAGKSLDDLLGGGAPPIPIVADPEQGFAAARGGVVLHATGSRLSDVLPDLEKAIRAGVHVVSLCEELSYPWWGHPDAAADLGALCELHDVAAVGLGVNPGFSLDRLPAFLSQVTGPVRQVRATRVQDVSRRRAGLQRKVGAGMTEDEFWAADDRGQVGHVGLVESALLVADGCGFDLDLDEVEVEQVIDPVIADEDLDGQVPIRAGQVAGVHQTARAFIGGQQRVQLDLFLYAGAEDTRDEIEIDATFPVKAAIAGGLPGDEAASWAVVNAAPAVARLRGLITVLELPGGR